PALRQASNRDDTLRHTVRPASDDADRCPITWWYPDHVGAPSLTALQPRPKPHATPHQRQHIVAREDSAPSLTRASIHNPGRPNRYEIVPRNSFRQESHAKTVAIQLPGHSHRRS